MSKVNILHFSFLAYLEVAQKFKGGEVTAYVVVDQVTTTSNLNPSCIEFELRLGFDYNKSTNENAAFFKLDMAPHLTIRSLFRPLIPLLTGSIFAYCDSSSACTGPTSMLMGLHH